MKQKFYSLIHNEKRIADASSSGGAFTALSDAWFDSCGDTAVVYGCVLDEDLKAKHIRATDKKTRDLMRGSKYISSDINGAFENAAVDLQSGKAVLFSGSPCQIAALKKYLQAKDVSFEKLFTVDFVCHGTGDNRFFDDYILHLEKKYKSKATTCSFRAKSKPGKLQDMEIVFENGKKYNSAFAKYDWFFSAYSKNYILRKSCFFCRFASFERVSDVTLGDNWGVETSQPASLVMVNTDLGLKYLENCAESVSLCELDKSQATQPNLISPSKKPDGYDEFNRIYKEFGYLEAQKFLGNNTPKAKLKVLFAELIYRLNLYSFLKKLIKKLK